MAKCIVYKEDGKYRALFSEDWPKVLPEDITFTFERQNASEVAEETRKMAIERGIKISNL